ncbi:hypothetical protein WJX79_004531 [Trebouxia sp. C0005]
MVCREISQPRCLLLLPATPSSYQVISFSCRQGDNAARVSSCQVSPTLGGHASRMSGESSGNQQKHPGSGARSHNRHRDQ